MRQELKYGGSITQTGNEVFKYILKFFSTFNRLCQTIQINTGITQLQKMIDPREQGK
jgi:hypothetical protein